jgi:hypothetical protein
MPMTNTPRASPLRHSSALRKTEFPEVEPRTDTQAGRAHAKVAIATVDRSPDPTPGAWSGKLTAGRGFLAEATAAGLAVDRVHARAEVIEY